MAFPRRPPRSGGACGDDLVEAMATMVKATESRVPKPMLDALVFNTYDKFFTWARKQNEDEASALATEEGYLKQVAAEKNKLTSLKEELLPYQERLLALVPEELREEFVKRTEAKVAKMMEATKFD